MVYHDCHAICDTHVSRMRRICQYLTNSCFFAEHLFADVGLAPCAMSTATAPVGTTFNIPFSVFDDGLPHLRSTVNRTVLVVPPCASGQAHSLIVC